VDRPRGEHLSNPWFTRSIIAPAGPARLPRPCPSRRADAAGHAAVRPDASYNLLSTHAGADVLRGVPGGAGGCHADPGGLRALRLSSIMAWHAWYQLNLAAGAGVPAAGAGAAVRLRRVQEGEGVGQAGGDPRRGPGASLLTDQESFVLVLIVCWPPAPWLVSPAWRQRLRRRRPLPWSSCWWPARRSRPRWRRLRAAHDPELHGGHRLRVFRHRDPPCSACLRAVHLGLTWLKRSATAGPSSMGCSPRPGAVRAGRGT
jgi:hypothetical protein